MLIKSSGGASAHTTCVPALRADGLTDEEHIAALVEIFLHGLGPEPGA
ncbi:MAG TPA: hypothetical protein VGP82_16645 [Ktedonobacterales bacterium]|nr:hypothetical protein [Ktedonobacterales bacterium]